MTRWWWYDDTMVMARWRWRDIILRYRHRAIVASLHHHRVIASSCYRVIVSSPSCHRVITIVLSWHRLPVWQSDMMTDTTPCVRASINNNNYCLWMWYSLQFWLYLNLTYTVVRYPWELGSFRKPVRFAHARLDYGSWNCQNCYSRACEHNRGSIYYLIFTKLTQ